MAQGLRLGNVPPIASPAGQAGPGRLAACTHIGPQNGVKKVSILGSTFGPPKWHFLNDLHYK